MRGQESGGGKTREERREDRGREGGEGREDGDKRYLKKDGERGIHDLSLHTKTNRPG